MAGGRRISYYEQNVVSFEDIAEFNLFNNTMLAKLAPVGALETFLAEHIVSLSWRLKRVAYMQKAVVEYLAAEAAAKLEAKLSPTAPSEGSNPPQNAPAANDRMKAAVARMVLNDFGEARVIEGLLSSQRRIEQRLQRAKAELRKLRRWREKDTGKGRNADEPPADWEEQSQSWDLPPAD